MSEEPYSHSIGGIPDKLPSFSFELEYGENPIQYVSCAQCHYRPPEGLQFTYRSQRINMKKQTVTYFFTAKCTFCEHENNVEIETRRGGLIF